MSRRVFLAPAVILMLVAIGGRFTLDRAGFPDLAWVDLRVVGLAAALAVLIVDIARRPPLELAGPRREGWLVASVLFFLYQIASGLWAPPAARVGPQTVDLLLMAALTVAFYLYAIGDPEAVVRTTFWLFYLAGIVFALAAIFINGPGEQGRYSAFGGGPNVFVRIQILGIIAAVALFLHYRRWWTLAAVPLFLLAAVLSGSPNGTASSTASAGPASARPAVRGITVSTPRPRTHSSSSKVADASTVCPARTANWAAKPPSPPLAPVTSTVAGADRSMMSSARRAVSPFSGTVAAITGSRPAGTRTSHAASAATSSAYPPTLPRVRYQGIIPATTSPTPRSVTSAPTATTSPAMSHPARNGGGTGPPGICPTRAAMSAGFTHTARTRTSTPPGPGAGSGSSTSSSTSGPPKALTTTARIDTPQSSPMLREAGRRWRPSLRTRAAGRSHHCHLRCRSVRPDRQRAGRLIHAARSAIIRTAG